MLQGIHEAGSLNRTTASTMRKPLTLLVATFLLACGPEAGEEDDIPGDLVYEQSGERLYRTDRRIDVIFDYERDDGLDGKCGFLTDRAYDDLETTLAALEPSADYGHGTDCNSHGALVHIDGFEHSPFDCSYECCHPDLRRAAIVYSVILNNFIGLTPPYDGEPYVAIEPDPPCP